MSTTRRVRITQTASEHAGDAGDVVWADNGLVFVYMGAGCRHIFSETEVEDIAPPPHRFSRDTLAILEGYRSACAVHPHMVGARCEADFDALLEHVRANLA